MFYNKTTFEEITKSINVLYEFYSVISKVIMNVFCRSLNVKRSMKSTSVFLLWEVFKSQKKLNNLNSCSKFMHRGQFNLHNKVLMSILKATSQRFGTQLRIQRRGQGNTNTNCCRQNSTSIIILCSHFP